jgi:hypothetical protein
VKLKWIRLLLLSTAVVLLTACGGGGLSEATEVAAQELDTLLKSSPIPIPRSFVIREFRKREDIKQLEEQDRIFRLEMELRQEVIELRNYVNWGY